MRHPRRNRYRHTAQQALWVMLVMCTACTEVAPERARPNVILVITDDQGYGDLGVHGNPLVQTPHLDALARQSVRLTDFHVDPTCSPTRSALLTGRYSTRTGVWHTIRGRSLMRPEEVTLAEMFADAGYRTAMVGKWHLGDNHPLRPHDQGFHEAFYHRGGVVGQVGDWLGNDFYDDTYFRQGQPEQTEGYATDVWFDEAIAFIERNREAPFFLYLATSAAHWPYLVDDAVAAPYRAQGATPTMAKFFGVIEEVDTNMGRLLARLDALGLTDDTIVLFTTDNGSAEGFDNWRNEPGTWTGYNAGMRDGKGSAYDGGHRVPFFLRWPGGGLGQARDIDRLTAHLDVLPTLADLTALPLPEGVALDGQSLAPLLRGDTTALPDRTLFVHSQRIDPPVPWRRTAVMTERWRLINGTELYDIQQDPAQAHDVAAAHPAVVSDLRTAYDAWWHSLTPAFDDTVRISLGAPEENPAVLTSHDWHTVDEAQSVWAARHVYQGREGNGFFAVDVRRAGRYAIELRRWPAHMGLWMGVGTARLQVKGEERAQILSPYDTRAVFTVDLPAGPARLQTWLGEHQGAYFVEVAYVGEE